MTASLAARLTQHCKVPYFKKYSCPLVTGCSLPHRPVSRSEVSYNLPSEVCYNLPIVKQSEIQLLKRAGVQRQGHLYSPSKQPHFINKLVLKPPLSHFSRNQSLLDVSFNRSKVCVRSLVTENVRTLVSGNVRTLVTGNVRTLVTENVRTLVTENAPPKKKKSKLKKMLKEYGPVFFCFHLFTSCATYAIFYTLVSR